VCTWAGEPYCQGYPDDRSLSGSLVVTNFGVVPMTPTVRYPHTNTRWVIYGNYACRLDTWGPS
jgi:hypothetical protein